MKAHCRTLNGRLVFELEADTQKALFKVIAELEGNGGRRPASRKK
jgi:hypothetical protein